MVVTEVNSELIAGTHDGKDIQVMFSDIESIEKRRFDILRTVLIVLGIIAVGQYASGVSKVTNPLHYCGATAPKPGSRPPSRDKLR
jgi:hypothetical protein